MATRLTESQEKLLKRFITEYEVAKRCVRTKTEIKEHYELIKNESWKYRLFLKLANYSNTLLTPLKGSSHYNTSIYFNKLSDLKRGSYTLKIELSIQIVCDFICEVLARFGTPAKNEYTSYNIILFDELVSYANHEIQTKDLHPNFNKIWSKYKFEFDKAILDTINMEEIHWRKDGVHNYRYYMWRICKHVSELYFYS